MSGVLISYKLNKNILYHLAICPRDFEKKLNLTVKAAKLLFYVFNRELICKRASIRTYL